MNICPNIHSQICIYLTQMYMDKCRYRYRYLKRHIQDAHSNAICNSSAIYNICIQMLQINVMITLERE